MAKRKSIKGQTTIYQTLHITQIIKHKTKDRVTRTSLGTGELRCPGSLSSPCSTSDKIYETANVEK